MRAYDALRAQLLPLYVPGLLFSTAWAGLQLAVPLYALGQGATAVQTGVIVALLELGSLVASTPGGALVARLSPRVGSVLGAIVLGVAVAVASVVPDIVAFAVVVFVMGLARGLWEVSRLAYARYSSAGPLRGRVLAALGGVHRLGSVLGPGAAGLIAATGGVSMAMRIAGVALVVAGVATAVLMRNTGMASRDRANERRSSLRTVLRHHWRDLTRNGGAIMILMLVRASRRLLLPVWGELQLGLDADTIGFAVSFSWAVDLSVVYVGGAVSDRFGRRIASSTALLIMSLGLWLLPIAHSYPLLLLVAGLMGAGNGFSSGLVMAMGADLAPRGQSGRFLGIWRLLADVGAASGPLAIGGAAQLLSLAAAGPVSGAIGLIGAALFLFVARETAGRPPDAGDAGQTPSG